MTIFVICPRCGDTEPQTTGTSHMCNGVSCILLTHAELTMARDLVDRAHQATKHPADRRLKGEIDARLAHTGSKIAETRIDDFKAVVYGLAGLGGGH